MSAYRDERREFIAEEREATRPEREMFAMSAILEGACMDRLSQLYDFDDFDDFQGAPAEILEGALKAEADECGGDWGKVRAEASAWLDDEIAEWLGA